MDAAYRNTAPELLLRFSFVLLAVFFFFVCVLFFKCRQLNLSALSHSHRGYGHNAAPNRRAQMHAAPAKANETHL